MTKRLSETTMRAKLTAMHGGEATDVLHYCTGDPVNTAGLVATTLATKAATIWTQTVGTNEWIATQAAKTGITESAGTGGDINNVAIVNSVGDFLFTTDCPTKTIGIGATFSMDPIILREPDLTV
jgi:hypothetical protein